MAISGISVPSLNAYYQQSQNASQVGAGPQTTVEQAASAALGAVAPPVGSFQQAASGHHHHGGGTSHTVDTLA